MLHSGQYYYSEIRDDCFYSRSIQAHYLVTLEGQKPLVNENYALGYIKGMFRQDGLQPW